MRYGIGLDAASDLLDLSVARGFVTKSGAYYSIGKQTIGHGREKARARLIEDAKLRERLELKLFAPPPAKAA